MRSGPQPGDTCRNCGGKGHWARECRTADEYGNMPAELRTAGGSVSIVTDGRNGVEVYLDLGLNGRGVYELLNTGCDTSVVSRRVIPNEQPKPTTQKIYSANGTEIVLLGEMERTLKLADFEVTAAVVVSEEVDDLIWHRLAGPPPLPLVVCSKSHRDRRQSR